jgi:hypothetical protein
MAQEKENLVVLFLAMLKKVPGLIQLMNSYIACFQGYFSAFFLPDDEIIKQSYRLFVELAFGRGFVEDEQQKEVLEKLHALKSSAQGKAQRGDFYYAALIFEALVSGCLNRYEDSHNHREIVSFVSECISLLQMTLSKADLKTEKRQHWLLEIFFCRNQIEANHKVFICRNRCELKAKQSHKKKISENCDATCPIWLAKKLDELILSLCKEEDVPILLKKAQSQKELLTREKTETIHCPFQRRNLIRFILRLLEIAKRTSDYITLAYSEGEGLFYVQKLIERKEIDKAIRYIQEKPLNVDEYFPLAETLESMGLKDKSPILMEMGLQKACDSKSPIVYKFAEYFLEKRNCNLALSALVACFELNGEIRIFKKIRQLSNRLGRWAETKKTLKSQLLAQKKYVLLTKVYLDDGEIENAVVTLKKFLDKPMGGKDARSVSFSRNSLMRKVAYEAEKSYPFEAILIYKQLAETQIAKVDRRSYRRACFALRKLKHLYTLLKEEGKWQDYIAQLRRQNAKKTAFLEEIEEL